MLGSLQRAKNGLPSHHFLIRSCGGSEGTLGECVRSRWSLEWRCVVNKSTAKSRIFGATGTTGHQIFPRARPREMAKASSQYQCWQSVQKFSTAASSPGRKSHRMRHSWYDHLLSNDYLRLIIHRPTKFLRSVW